VDGLLGAFELYSDALEILTLDKGTLGGISIYAKTILLVFLASLANVIFLRLLRLELFLNRGLKALSMMGLTGDKGGDGIFELISDLLGEMEMETGFLVCLFSKGIERVSEFA
jgi:hypothetical protein